MHEVLKRDAPQRVKIVLDSLPYATGTYELPFKVGVIGDFTGNEQTNLPPLADRKFSLLDENSLPRTMGQVRERTERRENARLPAAHRGEQPTLFEIARPNLHFEVDDVIRNDLIELKNDLGIETSQSSAPTETSQEPSRSPTLSVNLTFSCMESFSPGQIMEQVKPLKELYELRRALAQIRDLLMEDPRLRELLDNWASALVNKKAEQ